MVRQISANRPTFWRALFTGCVAIKGYKAGGGLAVPLIPALGGRGRHSSVVSLMLSLVYRLSSRRAKATQKEPVSKQTNKQTNKQKLFKQER